MEFEIWKDIPGYEGEYQASNWGQIRSLDRFVMVKGVLQRRKGKILRPRPTDSGHVRVNIKGKDLSIHRLVMLAFVGPSDLVVNHLDSNPKNNRLDNLEYTTHSGNMQHAVAAGRKVGLKGPDNPNSIVNEGMAREILYKHKIEKISQKQLSEDLGLGRSTIERTIHSDHWKYLHKEIIVQQIKLLEQELVALL